MKACKDARFILFAQVLKVDIYFCMKILLLLLFLQWMQLTGSGHTKNYWQHSQVPKDRVICFTFIEPVPLTTTGAPVLFLMLTFWPPAHYKPTNHCPFCTLWTDIALNSSVRHSTNRHGTEPFCALRTNRAKAFLCIINIAVTFLYILNTALNLSVHYKQM